MEFRFAYLSYAVMKLGIDKGLRDDQQNVLQTNGDLKHFTHIFTQTQTASNNNIFYTTFELVIRNGNTLAWRSPV